HSPDFCVSFHLSSHSYINTLALHDALPILSLRDNTVCSRHTLKTVQRTLCAGWYALLGLPQIAAFTNLGGYTTKTFCFINFKNCINYANRKLDTFSNACTV